MTIKELEKQGIHLNIVEKRNLEKLNKIPNGRNFKCIYQKDLSDEVYKEFKGLYRIIKISEMSIRKGINYENLKSTKEKRAQGDTRKDGVFFAHHINQTLMKHNTKDIYYIQAYQNSNGCSKAKTYYKVNGVVKTPQEMQTMKILKASAFSKSHPEVFTLKLSDIIDVK